MTYFVSYELLDANHAVANFGGVVVKNSSADEVMNDLEAIKNDAGVPDGFIRVLCLTVLSPEVQPL